MKRLQSKLKIGSLGLSLIELIISMAILAVVGTAIGGAMYVSSRSYTRGSAEINVQEEAQVATNLICDWLLDATEVSVDPSGTILTVKHPDDNYGEIVITVQRNGSNELVYDFIDPTAADPATANKHGLLAKYVTGVLFNSTFDTDRNVKISLDFKVNDRTYHSVTDSTSRSHDFISTGGTSVNNPPVIVFEGVVVSGVDGYVYLEPGQNDTASYTFTIKLVGCDPDTTTLTYDCTSSGHTNITCVRNGETNEYFVKCESNNDASLDGVYTFTASNAFGSDSKKAYILIRRANDIAVNTGATLSSGIYYATPLAGTGSTGTSGSKYSVDFNVSTQHNEATTGAFDVAPYNYFNATHVEYFYRIKNDSGAWVDASSYVAKVETKVEGSGVNPNVELTLNQNIDHDLYVYAVAVHSGRLVNPVSGINITSAADNKVAMIKADPSFTYTGSEAYYTCFVIKAGDSIPAFDNVGKGLRRGQPAAMCGEWTVGYRDALKDIIIKEYKRIHNIPEDQVVSYSTIHNAGDVRFSTVLWYKVAGAASYGNNYYVVYNGTDIDELISDYKSRRLRDDASNLFRMDTSYDVKFELQVFLTGQTDPILVSANTGSVPASMPYFYNPSNGLFSSTVYTDITANPETSNHLSYNTSSSPVTYSSGYWNYMYGNVYQDSGYKFPVFIEGVMLNNNKVNYKLQYLNGTSWEDAPSDCLQNLLWSEGDSVWDDSLGRNVSHGIYYGLTESSVKNITQVKVDEDNIFTISGYSENSYPDVGVNIEYVTILQNKLTAGQKYRIVFETDWPLTSVGNRGVIGGTAGQIGTISGHYNGSDFVADATNTHYTLRYPSNYSVESLRGQEVCIYIDT